MVFQFSYEILFLFLIWFLFLISILFLDFLKKIKNKLYYFFEISISISILIYICFFVYYILILYFGSETPHGKFTYELKNHGISIYITHDEAFKINFILTNSLLYFGFSLLVYIFYDKKIEKILINEIFFYLKNLENSNLNTYYFDNKKVILTNKIMNDFENIERKYNFNKNILLPFIIKKNKENKNRKLKIEKYIFRYKEIKIKTKNKKYIFILSYFYLNKIGLIFIRILDKEDL